MALNIRRSTAVLVAGGVAAVAPLSAVALNSAIAAPTAAHVQAVSHGSVKAWAEGTYKAGQSITVDADGTDAQGKAITTATVIGPVGIKGVLTPAADAGHLTGEIKIPASVSATWIRLTVSTSSGAVTHIVIHATPAKKPAIKPVPRTNLAWSKAWAEGTFQPGHALTVDADGFTSRGMAITSAKVAGPNGIAGVLTPAADAGHLTGEITIPKSVTSKTVRVKVTMADGQSTYVTFQRHA